MSKKVVEKYFFFLFIIVNFGKLRDDLYYVILIMQENILYIFISILENNII